MYGMGLWVTLACGFDPSVPKVHPNNDLNSILYFLARYFGQRETTWKGVTAYRYYSSLEDHKEGIFRIQAACGIHSSATLIC